MQRLILAALAAYGRWLSRWTPPCPQTPSCAAYAAQAVREHGVRRGVQLAHERLAGCRPDRLG